MSSVRFAAIASLVALSCAALAQKPPLIRLESPDLPEADRLHLLQTLEAGPPGTVDELIAKAVWTARDMGYFRATAQPTTGDRTPAAPGELIIAVTAGPQYHLGKISFENNHAIPANQLQTDLVLSPGDLFSTSLIGKCLSNIQQTYARAGYINEVTSPGLHTDEQTHVIDLDLQIDEGQVFTLGALAVTGNEPHPGAAGTLIRSWQEIQGAPFNPDTLDKWLEQNKAQCPACTRAHNLTFTQDPETHVLQVNLILPRPTGPA